MTGRGTGKTIVELIVIVLNSDHTDLTENLNRIRLLETGDSFHRVLKLKLVERMSKLQIEIGGGNVKFCTEPNLDLWVGNQFGHIPVANQFGTFNDPSIYEGNSELCGDPLPTNCSSLLPGNGEQEQKQKQEDDEKTERLVLSASIAVGFITGFWFVCGSLSLKRSWRHAYFNFVFDIRDILLVWIAVNSARAKRKFGLE